jgi:hypothetical protein
MVHPVQRIALFATVLRSHDLRLQRAAAVRALLRKLLTEKS